MTDDETTVRSVCHGWWARWVNADSGEARAAVARLRRVASPLDAALIPAVQDLNRRLDAVGKGLQNRADTLALIACALAACNHQKGRRAAQVFGTPSDQPPVSPLRLSGLVREPSPDRLRQPLIRALRQVRGAVDVAALAEDLYFWGEAVRTRWAFDYFGAGDAAPSFDQETTA